MANRSLSRIAVFTSSDEVGAEMSASLRKALDADGVVVSMVRSRRFAPLPHIAAHGLSAQELADRCRELGVGLVIPVVERMAELAAEVSVCLSAPGPTAAAVRILTDKFAFLKLLDGLGLGRARPEIVERMSEFAELPERAIFVKPTGSSGSHSDSPYDYCAFASPIALCEYLTTAGLLDAFLADNRHGGPFGKHLISDHIDCDGTYNIAVVTAHGRSEPFANMKLTYFPGDTSGSAIAWRATEAVPTHIADALRAAIDRIAEAVELDTALWGLEYAIDGDGRLQIFEAHSRLPQTHSFVADLMFHDFWLNIVRALLGEPFVLTPVAAHAVRHTIALRPGTIRAIEWPARADIRLVLANSVRPGYRVPQLLRRPDYEAAACGVGDDIGDVHRRIASYLSSVHVTYEGEPVQTAAQDGSDVHHSRQ